MGPMLQLHSSYANLTRIIVSTWYLVLTAVMLANQKVACRLKATKGVSKAGRVTWKLYGRINRG